ncbi:uncharacterized protein TRAVEDRAFT_49709 [Trametes versicolor FP-101664 SS1]|uniref:uncharacterized protein n=1 Tax=Trametes versicolor (strain FP-101664) TaxID=717944 RepID=UPI000462499A|nr:uncharacterized protein TRAVEDRAFT_49709 [Trametes versicolor FP-101664 SS1]EIW56897.1 hypothetical protein TRAVEDRAFT_49709 [Trametes versicolor FP-101664 SS1]
MFSFPVPPPESSAAADTTGSACPVVQLFDSPEDVRHILRFYMPRDDPSPFSTNEISFHMISAAVRLGQKYQMSKLYQHAIDYLKDYFTEHLDVWEAHTDDGRLPPGFSDVHAIGVVNLARLTGEHTLLPTALLSCCMLGKAIVHGFAREDGTREQLALADVGLCFAAKGRLIEESVRIALAVFLPTVAKMCASVSECVRGFRKIHVELKDRARYIATADPFVPYHSMFGEELLCKHCRAMVKERDLWERSSTWSRLSEILGIESTASDGAGTGDDA